MEKRDKDTFYLDVPDEVVDDAIETLENLLAGDKKHFSLGEFMDDFMATIGHEAAKRGLKGPRLGLEFASVYLLGVLVGKRLTCPRMCGEHQAENPVWN